MPVFRLVGVLTLLVLVSGAPAHAHGAPTDPASRAFLCSPGQPTASSPLCRGAVAAGLPSEEWDNIRLADVRGRDAAMVPDGKLCSAGLPRYAGLDVPSAAWPATKLGSTAFTYRATIPHRGSFRFYVTRDGYSPARPLRWADLERFLTVPGPPLVNGSYEFRVRLPENRTGRHLIYTVWQNTDTPDTYYSCTDVEIAAPAAQVAPAPVAQPAPATSAPATARAPVSASPTPSAPRSSIPSPVPVASSAGHPPSSATRLGLSAVVAALGGLVVLGGTMLWRRRIL
ncbi:lytic polysaccharide monooxygenase auxiliary activity family 9 protein [Lentzea jiangxiensis]|uniref:Chitin-binding protein n=1 Tax=Lentzea jiangxiensis TaxID=641025 RepID=A0A1H0PI08_9PSEU|nr:lytic polysaccharide monooxygenase [Lentzea jiangxiensis]SDP04701.1 chitin-binding protein [Lentzea jiangxiensis]